MTGDPRKGKQQGTTMKTALSLAVLIALGASPVLAKATYCKDPTTHKHISCKVAATPVPAAKPAKHSLFAKKPATDAMAAPAAKPTAMAASGLTASGKPHKGIKCGNSYIAANKVCHKN